MPPCWRHTVTVVTSVVCHRCAHRSCGRKAKWVAKVYPFTIYHCKSIWSNDISWLFLLVRGVQLSYYAAACFGRELLEWFRSFDVLFAGSCGEWPQNLERQQPVRGIFSLNQSGSRIQSVPFLWTDLNDVLWSGERGSCYSLCLEVFTDLLSLFSF